MDAPGFGGPPLKQRAVPQAAEATQDADEISSSSHPLTWLTGSWMGSWWGNGHNNFEAANAIEPEVDATDLTLAADEPGYLENAERARNGNDEGMVLEVGPDAVQALANELQQTLMAAFGQGNVRVRADRGDFRNHFEVKVQRDDDRDADQDLLDGEDESSGEQRQRDFRQADQQNQPRLHAEL